MGLLGKKDGWILGKVIKEGLTILSAQTIDLPDYIDADTITTPGKYWIKYRSSHIPITRGSILIVIDGNGIAQFFVNTDTCSIFMRTNPGSAWSEWKSLI